MHFLPGDLIIFLFIWINPLTTYLRQNIQHIGCYKGRRLRFSADSERVSAIIHSLCGATVELYSIYD